jgi:4-amino-4-deoxy-L-arabinose transferase-like glycosyltransferase
LAFIFKIVGIKEAAYYILPALYLVGFFSVSFLYLKRCVGQGVAGTTCLLFLSVPIVRDMGGRNYPDFIELTWVLAALALIFEAYKAPRGRARYILLVLSGLSASLALLTRETSAWVILVYAFLFLRGKPFTRTEMLYVLAGALPLLLADTLYLHVMTGDWLYRLHVSSAHTTILSSHMRGGTFNGPVLFNAELAKRWTVDGPFYVHWAVNPLEPVFKSS